MDGLEIARAHVLGLSMGGMIAQEFALRHASRVDRLVLSGSSAAPARVAFDPIRTWSWVKRDRRDRRDFRRPAVHMALLHRLPAQPGGGAANHRHVDEQSEPDRRGGLRATGPGVSPARRTRPARRHHVADARDRRRAGSAHAAVGLPRGRRQDSRLRIRGHHAATDRRMWCRSSVPHDFNRLVTDVPHRFAHCLFSAFCSFTNGSWLTRSAPSPARSKSAMSKTTDENAKAKTSGMRMLLRRASPN